MPERSNSIEQFVTINHSIEGCCPFITIKSNSTLEAVEYAADILKAREFSPEETILVLYDIDEVLNYPTHHIPRLRDPSIRESEQMWLLEIDTDLLDLSIRTIDQSTSACITPVVLTDRVQEYQILEDFNLKRFREGLGKTLAKFAVGLINPRPLCSIPKRMLGGTIQTIIPPAYWIGMNSMAKLVGRPVKFDWYRQIQESDGYLDGARPFTFSDSQGILEVTDQQTESKCSPLTVITNARKTLTGAILAGGFEDGSLHRSDDELLRQIIIQLSPSAFIFFDGKGQSHKSTIQLANSLQSPTEFIYCDIDVTKS